MSDFLDNLPPLPPASYTIEIDPPVTFSGGEYKQLVLREPKAGEVRQADEQLRLGVTQHALDNRNIHLIAKVAGVPVPVVELLGVTRVKIAMAYIDPFLAYGPETG